MFWIVKMKNCKYLSRKTGTESYVNREQFFSLSLVDLVSERFAFAHKIDEETKEGLLVVWKIMCNLIYFIGNE